jgi:hypothetical protein
MHLEKVAVIARTSDVLRWLLPMKSYAALLFFLLALCPASPSQTPVSEFWPQINAQIQIPRHFRTTAYVGMQNSESFPYQQIFGGADLGYQWKRITKRHVANSDSDKEHTLVIAAGYEYLHTLNSGKIKDEDRGLLQGTIARRPWSPLLITDRNRVEFRWVNGDYSTRYRNLLTLNYDLLVRKHRLTPYGAAEAYYDGGKGSWNEEQYTAGIEWPVHRLFAMQTYYLRQHCTTCNPVNVNAAGLNLNIYLNPPK